MLEIFDFEQRSPEWFKCRAGLPTASEFSSVLAKGEGKTRAAYMRKLAAEIITGEPGESFDTPAMERGRRMEAEARDFYAFLSDVPLQSVGFIKNGNKGCSPDSLIGDNGLLEIKTQRADLLIENLLRKDFPPEHRAQTQGALWVSEREWIDLSIYWPKMPSCIFRAYRDETYIKALSDAVDAFNDELQTLVAKLRSHETRKAA